MGTIQLAKNGGKDNIAIQNVQTSRQPLLIIPPNGMGLGQLRALKDQGE